MCFHFILFICLNCSLFFSSCFESVYEIYAYEFIERERNEAHKRQKMQVQKLVNAEKKKKIKDEWSRRNVVFVAVHKMHSKWC